MPQEKSNVKTRSRYKKPRMYKVVIYNDDVTTMEFVVMLLEKIFHKSHEDAEKLMMDIHTSGMAVVGIYTYDMARTKVGRATLMAQEKGFPLRIVYKPENE